MRCSLQPETISHVGLRSYRGCSLSSPLPGAPDRGFREVWHRESFRFNRFIDDGIDLAVRLLLIGPMIRLPFRSVVFRSTEGMLIE